MLPNFDCKNGTLILCTLLSSTVSLSCHRRNNGFHPANNTHPMGILHVYLWWEGHYRDNMDMNDRTCTTLWAVGLPRSFARNPQLADCSTSISACCMSHKCHGAWPGDPAPPAFYKFRCSPDASICWYKLFSHAAPIPARIVDGGCCWCRTYLYLKLIITARWAWSLRHTCTSCPSGTAALSLAVFGAGMAANFCFVVRVGVSERFVPCREATFQSVNRNFKFSHI